MFSVQRPNIKSNRNLEITSLDIASLKIILLKYTSIDRLGIKMHDNNMTLFTFQRNRLTAFINDESQNVWVSHYKIL